MAASSSSPSKEPQLKDEEDREQEEQHQQPQPVKECVHKTKTIQFLGRTTPIVLQNDNGPCPLLAICKCISHPRVSSFRIFSFSCLIPKIPFSLLPLLTTKLDCVRDTEFYLSLSLPLTLNEFSHLLPLLLIDYYWSRIAWNLSSFFFLSDFEFVYQHVWICLVFSYFLLLVFTPHQTPLAPFVFVSGSYHSVIFGLQL